MQPNEIRDELTPEQWLQGLRSIRARYEQQWIEAKVDRAVIQSATDGLPESTKDIVVANKQAEIDLLKARIDEIDERLGGAAEGAAGVNRTLELLRQEMATALALCGQPSIRELTPAVVCRAD